MDRLHPDSRHVLELTSSWAPPGEPTVEWARATEARRQRELDTAAEPVERIETLSIDTAGGMVPVIVHHPSTEPGGVLVLLHGGGWTIGSPDLWRTQACALANAAGCVVVAPAFRLAPEHRYPAGLEDAYATTCWAAEQLSTLGIHDGAVVVGGDSSGGNLAAAVTLMCRDRLGPTLAGQLLVYPATARDRATPSRTLFAEGFGLTTDALMWFWQHYLGDADASHPYISPLLADDLSGLPPAVVATAGCDVLRDEGEEYAERLRHAGVSVSARRFDGMLHGFLGFGGVVADVREAYDWIGGELRALFSAATASEHPTGRRASRS